MSLYTKNYLSGMRFKKMRHLKRAGTFVFGLFVCAFFILYVWQRVSVIQTGYKVGELKKEKAGLVKSREMLRIEAATLTSPDRVERIATTRLGMRTPDDSQIVLVKRVKSGAGGAPDENSQVRRPAGVPGRS